MLHKRAIPTTTLSKPDKHSEPLFKELEILKLPYVVTLHYALFIYQYHNNLLQSSFENFFSDSIIKTSVIFGLPLNRLITSITLKQTMENSTSALQLQKFGIM